MYVFKINTIYYIYNIYKGIRTPNKKARNQGKNKDI